MGDSRRQWFIICLPRKAPLHGSPYASVVMANFPVVSNMTKGRILLLNERAVTNSKMKQLLISSINGKL